MRKHINRSPHKAMTIKSIEEIITLLREQANLRSEENDERGLLRDAAEFIEREARDL